MTQMFIYLFITYDLQHMNAFVVHKPFSRHLIYFLDLFYKANHTDTIIQS